MKKFALASFVAFGVLTLAPFAAQANPQAAAASAGGAKPYGEVIEGKKVNAFTMDGFRTWRQAACDRCHGANQEGSVGPSLIESLKAMPKDQFIATVKDGRLDKGMPSFGSNPAVAEKMENLYAYLKGRSDGAITVTKPEPQAQ